ncbi:hypothetical protein GCM10023322_10180 [Rugosimonospora acidiphila]|uniref:Calx-beta domain-containing protein n=1 Tax=Rugosimonospora acidiphila TaxID=556531 RepID=A0ABP9RKM0_9ACTN
MTMSRRLGVAGVVLAAMVAMVFGLGAGPAGASGTGLMPAAAPTTPAPTVSLCRDCMTVNDAICWEVPPYRCTVPVFIGWIAEDDVVVHYTTVDRSAVAGVDYTPVKDALVTVPKGSQVGSGVIELTVGKPLDRDRTLLVELSRPSQGRLLRTAATVTIAAGQPGKTPARK